MRGSQSEFRPEPKNVWHTMKITRKEPRFLQSVMQAITNLKEVNGSTQIKIMNYIQGIINAKNITPRPRGLAMQIRKALSHGVENGLIRHRAGKYKIALSRKDFAIIKSCQPADPLVDCGYCEKARKRREKRRRSIGRKRTLRRKRRFDSVTKTGKYKIASSRKNINSFRPADTLVDCGHCEKGRKRREERRKRRKKQRRSRDKKKKCGKDT